MNISKRCSSCGAEVDSEGTVKSGTVSGGIILPSMQVENGMGPHVKECWNKGICPCCLHSTLKYIENSGEKEK